MIALSLLRAVPRRTSNPTTGQRTAFGGTMQGSDILLMLNRVMLGLIAEHQP